MNNPVVDFIDKRIAELKTVIGGINAGRVLSVQTISVDPQYDDVSPIFSENGKALVVAALHKELESLETSRTALTGLV